MISGIILFIILISLSVIFIKRRYSKILKKKQQYANSLRNGNLNNNNNNNQQQQPCTNIYSQFPPSLQQQQQPTLPISLVLLNDHQETNPLLDQTPSLIPKTLGLNLDNVKLIQEISHGQFSTVWKGKFSNDIADLVVKSDDLCAVKIFQSYEKQSWSNEKDIYSFLNDNEFVLK